LLEEEKFQDRDQPDGEKPKASLRNEDTRNVPSRAWHNTRLVHSELIEDLGPTRQESKHPQPKEDLLMVVIGDAPENASLSGREAYI
jgi:hypothetical protein